MLKVSDPTELFKEGGNAIATCPTCPNTSEFQFFINDKNNEYIYDSDTNTVSKVTQIEEVVVTGDMLDESVGTYEMYDGVY